MQGGRAPGIPAIGREGSPILLQCDPDRNPFKNMPKFNPEIIKGKENGFKER
jgi:hypothetical protein